MDARLREGLIWLSLKRGGWTTKQIWRHCSPTLCLRAVQIRLKEASHYFALMYSPDAKRKKNLPRFLVLTPIGLMSPTAPCAHKGAIPKGAEVYCVQCHRTGCDHWQVFRDMRDAPMLDGSTERPLMPETGSSKRKKGKAT